MLPTGINPVAVEVDPVLHTVVVSKDFAKTLTVLGTSAGPANTRVDSTVAVGEDPLALAVDTTTHQVLVVNNQSDSVSVLTALSATGSVSRRRCVRGTPTVAAGPTYWIPPR